MYSVLWRSYTQFRTTRAITHITCYLPGVHTLFEKLIVLQLLYMEPYGSFRVHKSPPLAPILSQIKPVHAIPFYLSSEIPASSITAVVPWLYSCHYPTRFWRLLTLWDGIWSRYFAHIKQVTSCYNCQYDSCISQQQLNFNMITN
jgi:hypothetical protein